MYARLDSSAVWVLWTRGNQRVGYDWGLLSLSYLLLARSYEALGDTDRAVQYYERFLNIWKDAEPDLRHYADEARQGLGRLRGERR